MTKVLPKDAAQAAIEFVNELIGTQSLSHLRVEEIGLSQDERAWNVTLGWDDNAVTHNRPLTLIPSRTNVINFTNVRFGTY
jgi:hypothetical protein